MAYRTIGTIYGDATCTRCGIPTGLSRTSDGRCMRCYSAGQDVQKITRTYLARIKPNISPTCPYDAIAKYEPEALADYASR